MQETTWPRVYSYSNRAAIQRRNMGILLVGMMVSDLLITWHFEHPLGFMLLGVFGLLTIWVATWYRGAAAELWPEKVRLPSYHRRKLVLIYFNEIVRLEMIGGRILIGEFVRNGKTERVGLDLGLVEESKELESTLIEKTGLTPQPTTPWWLQLAEVTGGPDYLDQVRSWKEGVLYSKLRFVVALVLGLAVGIVVIVAYTLVGKSAPAWALVGSAVLTYLLAYAWLERRRKKKASK